MGETYVQVNAPTNPDKKLKGYDSVDGHGDNVIAEAVTLVNSDGTETGVIANPLWVDINSALPAGTNTIGKVDQGAAGASPWEVTAAALPLPAGAATEATLQTVQADTASIDSGVTSIDAKTVHVDTGAVTVVASSLPTGAATEATVAAIKAKTDNLDVLLSTRAVTGLTDAELRAAPVPVSGTVTVSVPVAVTGPLTDAQLRASAVPVSAAALPLPAGAATDAGLAAIFARQADGTQHTIVDNAVAVTGPLTDVQLRASAVPVSAVALPLPAGAATEATLATRLADASFTARINTLGQKVMASSTPVVIASDQSAVAVTGPLTDAQLRASAVPVSAAALPLPAGAATSANQTTVGSQTTKINDGTHTAAVTAANALQVDGSGVTQPVSAVALPLPAGAATEATLATRLADASFTARINTLGQKVMASSTPVVIASDQSAVAVTGPLTDAQLRASAVPVSAAALPLPAGAATEATLATRLADASFTARVNVLGQNTMANSTPIVIASDQSNVPVSNPAVIDAGNSTTTPLASGAVYLGTPVDVSAYGCITIFTESDIAGFVGYQFSSDGVNWDLTYSENVAAGQAASVSVEPLAKWFRIDYLNGNSPMATFRLQTILRRYPPSIAEAMATRQRSMPAKVVAVGGDDGTVHIRPISVSSSGNVNVNAFSSPTAGINQQASVFDLDTGVFTQLVAGASLRRSANGGSVELIGQATMANSIPVTIASDQGAVPVSGPLTDTQLRASAVPVSGPLTDTQLRASVVPISVGAWFGSVAPTVGQKASAASLPLTVANDQVYAEDTAHSSGDTVFMAGVVQQAADAALSGDGDRSLAQVDATGWLKVNVKAQVIERATAGDPVGVIVSTVAVQLLPSNASARSRIITNNGTSNIFIGRANTVTASGVAMGVKLLPGGSYNDSGVDMYTGAIFAIGDAVAAVANVSAWERT